MKNRVFKKIFYLYTILVILVFCNPADEINVFEIVKLAVFYFVWMVMVVIFIEMKKQDRKEKQEKLRQSKRKSVDKYFGN